MKGGVDVSRKRLPFQYSGENPLHRHGVSLGGIGLGPPDMVSLAHNIDTRCVNGNSGGGVSGSCNPPQMVPWRYNLLPFHPTATEASSRVQTTVLPQILL